MLVTIIALERAGRRLLPLAALLNLSLLFPDRAPKRFAVARRVGKPRDLQRQLQEARDRGVTGGEVAHMQEVLELVAALSVHDRQTRGHSERVRVFTDLIAEEMKLAPGDRARLRWASLLHDIGKLVVPAEILSKPSKLSEAEMDNVRRHPDEGARLIGPLNAWLGEWAGAVPDHHERFDGRGYPRGLAGEQISLAGRIVAVADSYEVMTAMRPYRKPIGVSAARQELVRCSGAQFDPMVVRAFLNISMGRLWRVVGLGSWIAQLPLIGWIDRLGWNWGAAIMSGTTALGLTVPGIVGSPTPVATPTFGVLGRCHWRCGRSDIRRIRWRCRYGDRIVRRVRRDKCGINRTEQRESRECRHICLGSPVTGIDTSDTDAERFTGIADAHTNSDPRRNSHPTARSPAGRDGQSRGARGPRSFQQRLGQLHRPRPCGAYVHRDGELR